MSGPGWPLTRIVPRGSFQRLSSPATLGAAWAACRKGKRRTPEIARFDLDADRHILRLSDDLRGGRWIPDPWRHHLVHDPKLRCISVPSVRDRLLHHALIDTLAPAYERGFLDQSYACRTGRGPHRAVLRALRWHREHAWHLHLDVRGYFPHIDHDVLLDLYARRLRDADTLRLLAGLLAHGGAVWQSALARRVASLPEDHPATVGLPVGTLLSHFSGALYLDALDHHVKRTLKVPGYLRYMDDLLLYHDDRGALQAAWEAIAAWLAAERHLTLKPSRAGITSTRTATTALGQRISRAGLAPGPKLRRRMRRRLREAIRKGPDALRRTLSTYRGMILGR